MGKALQFTKVALTGHVISTALGRDFAGRYACTLIKSVRSNLSFARGTPVISETRTPLPYGVHAINPGSEECVLYVKLYPHKAEDEKQKMVVRAGARYYDTFQRELKVLWEAAAE